MQRFVLNAIPIFLSMVEIELQKQRQMYNFCQQTGKVRMSKLYILREFWLFMQERKKWWLAPILIFLLLLSFLIVFAEGSALAPFIYSLF